ncbi:hypothetical protein B0H14DRAFT_3883433 [Mycena olivaceomarginata]|nr:hypothetical protein B0H14DRAFT_3883433 [Mycena olivaceomarginata]
MRRLRTLEVLRALVPHERAVFGAAKERAHALVVLFDQHVLPRHSETRTEDAELPALERVPVSAGRLEGDVELKARPREENAEAAQDDFATELERNRLHLGRSKLMCHRLDVTDTPCGSTATMLDAEADVDDLALDTLVIAIPHREVSNARWYPIIEWRNFSGGMSSGAICTCESCFPFDVMQVAPFGAGYAAVGHHEQREHSTKIGSQTF